jgi:hypothetical protein
MVPDTDAVPDTGPTRDPRRFALLAVGLLLVTTPVWAPLLDVTGRDYQYRAARVSVEDDRLRIPGDHPRLAGLDDVDCFHERLPSRRCGFESRLIDGSSVAATYPGVRHVAGDPSLDASEPYVAFAGDGRVFRRTTGWNDAAGRFVLGLERVNASRALADAAHPVEQYAPPVRRAVERGSSQADDPLAEPALVTAGGRYYVVYTAGTRSVLSAEPRTERSFELGAVVAGVLALRRAWWRPDVRDA